MALFWTSPKDLIPMEMYSLLINSGSFPKLANVGQPPTPNHSQRLANLPLAWSAVTQSKTSQDLHAKNFNHVSKAKRAFSSSEIGMEQEMYIPKKGIDRPTSKVDITRAVLIRME